MVSHRIAGRFFVVVVVAAAAAFAQSSTAQAALVTLDAVQDQSEVSSFTLDFGAFGGPRSALISETQYQLQLDANAAPGSSAAFVSYNQSVDSLGLPNPQGGEDLQTGPLTITIEQSFGGTFDESTGIVTTNDLYRIEFTGDLSALGLTSPVYLPGDSTGEVVFDTLTDGRIELNWEGVGNIGGIDFSYTCRTNTLFAVVPEPSSLALLGIAAIACLRGRRRR